MTTPNPRSVAGRSTPIQTAAFTVASIFVLAGILGFIPGITTHYDTLAWAGHHSGAKLLGLFNVSVLHNVVHLAFGVAGVLMLRTAQSTRLYLIGGGIIYAVLWLYGLVIDRDSAANFIPVNSADNWLHFGLAVGMILLGAVLGRVGVGSHRLRHPRAGPTGSTA